MQPWPNSSLKLTFSQFGIGGKQPILVLQGQTLLQCKQTINLLCIYNNCSIYMYKYIWDGLITNITFNFVLTRNFTVQWFGVETKVHTRTKLRYWWLIGISVFNPEQFICSQFMEYHMIDCHVTYLRMGVWFPQDGVGNQTSLLPGKKLFCETMLQYHQWHNGANKLILYIILKCQSIMGIVLS